MRRRDAVDCTRCWIPWVDCYWIAVDRVVGKFVDSVDFHPNCCATAIAGYSSYWFSGRLVCRRWSLYLELVSLGHRNTSNRHRPCTERPHMCHRIDIAAQISSVTQTDAQSHAISDTLCTNNILNRIIWWKEKSLMNQMMKSNRSQCTAMPLQMRQNVIRWCLPLHGPRCFKLTLWPPHWARIRWHRVAYVWLSEPHTARAFDSSHSPPFAVQLNIYGRKWNNAIGQNSERRMNWTL